MQNTFTALHKLAIPPSKAGVAKSTLPRNKIIIILNIMPFWGLRADFNPPKEGSKSARNPLKRHNAIEPRLKKRTKIASRRGSIALCLFRGFWAYLELLFGA